MPRDDPWDATCICRYCHERGVHTVDCPWLLAMVEADRHYLARIAALEAEIERLRLSLASATPTRGDE